MKDVLVKTKEKKPSKKDLKIQLLVEQLEGEKKGTIKQKKLDQKTISNQTKAILELQKELSEVKNVTHNFNIEAPYVRCKINVVKSGKFPKTEMSLSAGGAMDQISFPDIETHTESLIKIIKKEVDDTMSKLDVEE